MPSDRLETMLDDLALAPEPAAPPPQFLAAVGTRRRRRKAAQAAYALALTLVVAGLTVVFVQPPETHAPPTVAGAPLPDDSIATLRRANHGAHGVVLPDGPTAAPGEVITVGRRLDPDEISAWVTGS